MRDYYNFTDGVQGKYYHRYMEKENTMFGYYRAGLGQEKKKPGPEPEREGYWEMFKIIIYLGAIVIAGVVGYNVGYEKAFGQGLAIGKMKALGWA